MGKQRFQEQNRQHLLAIAIAAFCAMNAMWIAVALYAGESTGIAAGHATLLRWAGTLLGLAAAVGPGAVFFRGAWGSLRTRTPHMDLPLAIGLGAGTLGSLLATFRGTNDVYFDSLAALVFLLLVGRWVQFRQQRRASQAVTLLMRLTPAYARRYREDGSIQTVPADQLSPGDRIEVRAGDAIAGDGVVIDGRSAINRALLTGESQPVAVNIGDTVAAATLNLTSPLQVRITAVGRESRVGRLMQVVEESASRQTPIVRVADQIGGWFVRVVVVLAIVNAVAWGWWMHDTDGALRHTIALLIVACPCALALATPLTISVARTLR